MGQNRVGTHPAKIYLMNNHDNNFIGLSLRQEEEEEDGKGVIRHSNVKEFATILRNSRYHFPVEMLTR